VATRLAANALLLTRCRRRPRSDRPWFEEHADFVSVQVRAARGMRHRASKLRLTLRTGDAF
jgi:hypothetical protein